MATSALLRFTGAAYRASSRTHSLTAAPPTVPIPRPQLSPRRALSATAPQRSGHNRWSKIKHDKAKTDARSTKARSALAKSLEAASREGGADAQSNPRLAQLQRQAAALGFPKTSVAAAVARGQGVSPSGAALTPYSVEFQHGATGAAAVVDCLTDNKARTLQVLREAMRDCGAAHGATAWLFERRGRLVYDGEAEVEVDEMAFMDAASAAGALDVEFPRSEERDLWGAEEEVDGAEAVVLTEPQDMARVAEGMEEALKRRPERMELAWVPRVESAVTGPKEGDEDEDGRWASLHKLVTRCEDESSVAAVWLNVR